MTATKKETRIMMKTLIRTLAACGMTLALAVPSAQAQTSDIVETAVGAGTFKTLAAALQAAGLVDTLKGAGPFTVFAPTDAAFAKLPAGTVASLLEPANLDSLRRILTSHVVAGTVLSSDVVKLSSAKTLSGYTVDIMVKNGQVSIDEATVAKADVMASNGVIHVIDAVILPGPGE
jgi:uncharacterized surface protein with fasciclin (FAS1) repeats